MVDVALRNVYKSICLPVYTRTSVEQRKIVASSITGASAHIDLRDNCLKYESDPHP